MESASKSGWLIGLWSSEFFLKCFRSTSVFLAWVATHWLRDGLMERGYSFESGVDFSGKLATFEMSENPGLEMSKKAVGGLKIWSPGGRDLKSEYTSPKFI